MTDKLFVAAKGIIKHDGKFLILREASTDPENTKVGIYCAPGGRLEPGENIKEAFAREIKEETGLTVKIKKPVYVDEWRPEVNGQKWQIVGIFFECEADTDKVTLSKEHDDYKWIDPKDANKYKLTKQLQDIFSSDTYIKSS